jgi:hypothetical protein
MSITCHVLFFHLETNYKQKLSAIRLHFFTYASLKFSTIPVFIFFFGVQMVFPCLFDEIPALRDLKEAAHLLAEKEDWPPLYDVSVLNNNKVPSSL